MDELEHGDIVYYNGIKMTLLEQDGETAVCQWKVNGKLKANLFRLKDLREQLDRSYRSK